MGLIIAVQNPKKWNPLRVFIILLVQNRPSLRNYIEKFGKKVGPPMRKGREKCKLNNESHEGIRNEYDTSIFP